MNKFVECTETLLREIRRLEQRPHLLIAIDGRCGAGKTTLAARLQDVTGGNVIHTDHFFLRPEQRTAERMSEPGGNIDYERLLSDVIMPITRGDIFSYIPFDCRRQAFSDAIFVQPDNINIIEGSYSCHPTLRRYYSLSVFLSVGPKIQLARIRQRDGNDCLNDFTTKWIPLEERYFASCRVEANCDFVFTGCAFT